MRQEVAAAALVLVLLATAGCTEALGGEPAEIEIDSEEDGQGQTFLYVVSTSGQLPADTEITVQHSLSDGEPASGTLDRPANENTKVYVGGPLGTDSATDFRHGMAPGASIVPPNVAVEVTITVDTGDQTVSKTMQFDA